MVAAAWRHVGYVMIIYLAGLKAVDPALKEAAAIDGASETQTFFRVVFPTLRPINVIVLVITVIEALRAFDIVYAINKGRNGLELLSVLVTENIVGEASRIGFGSAIAVDPAGDLARVHRRLSDAALQGGALTTASTDAPAPNPRRRPPRRRVRPLRILLHAFLGLVALGWLAPLRSPSTPRCGPYQETAGLGYFSLPETLTLDYYSAGVDPGRTAQVLPQHAASSWSRACS